MADTVEQDADEAAGEILRRFLADRDAGCPGCGYNLRGLTGGVCPECGQGLVLSLQLREPKQAALIAGLVGLSMGAGLGGLLLIYLAIISFFTRRGGPPDVFLLVNTTGFVVHAAAIGCWVRWWNAIRRLSPSRRGMLVAICWLMPLTFIVIFSIALR